MRYSLRTLLIILAVLPAIAAFVYWRNYPQLSRAEQIQICNAVLNDLLNNPELTDSRDFYGTLGDKQFALVSYLESGCRWPSWFEPSFSGYKCHRFDENSVVNHSDPRMLGFRLDKFRPLEKIDGLFDGQIIVTITNAGGSGNGGVIGGCNFYFAAERRDGRWGIKFHGALDP
ncbi:MAG TPA: hypothetical protein VGI40_21715 [Pirellulaceae bacterium]|jgi:hypothetical protein